MRKIQCAYCSKSVEIRPNERGNHRRKFCSEKCCRASYRDKRRQVYLVACKKVCLECGRRFNAAPTRVRGPLEQKFCKDACARLYRNALRRKGPGFKKSQHLSMHSADALAEAIAPLAKAYFAGLIDGEGTITTHLGRGIRQKSYTERIRVSVAMTNQAPIRAFHDRFGGCFRISKRQNPKWRDCYFCELNGWRAYACLKAIFPYLIAKREQARLAIEFQLSRTTIVGSRISWHPEVASQRRDYHLAIRKLNRRGA